MEVHPNDRVAPAGALWWGTAAILVTLCATSAALSRTDLHDLLYTPGIVGLALAFAIVVVRRRLEPRGAWSLLALGLFVNALGDAVYALPWSSDVGSSGISWADPLYVLGSLAMVAGALRLKSTDVGERDREALIDAASIGLAATVLLWQPLVEPRLNVDGAPMLARIINASYPVLDVVVVAMMLWMLFGARRRTPAALLLVAGAVLYLTADLAYTMRIDQGTIDDPNLNWLDILWLVASGLYLLAAMHPTAQAPQPPITADDRTLSRGRLALSGLTLLAPMLAIGLTDPDLSHLVFVIVIEVVLVVLVLFRISDFASGERRAKQAVVDRERYFRSLVESSSEAMVVIDATGVVVDASPAVRRLLGVAPDELIGRRPELVVAALADPLVVAMLDDALARPGAVVPAELAVTTEDHSLWLELRTTNQLADPAVAGLVVNLNDATARHQLQADLERRAFTDSLTGLPNRSLFHDRLEQLLSRREPPDVAVIYCDLDRFKSVNDEYGHLEGDHLLEVTAARLAAAIRVEDTVARLGGDEFAVIVQGDDALGHAQRIGARIVEELRRPLAVGAADVPVSVSVGVARARRGVDGARTVMRDADEAMYRAKRSGGDRVVVFGAAPPATASGPGDPGPTDRTDRSPLSPRA